MALSDVHDDFMSTLVRSVRSDGGSHNRSIHMCRNKNGVYGTV